MGCPACGLGVDRPLLFPIAPTQTPSVAMQGEEGGRATVLSPSALRSFASIAASSKDYRAHDRLRREAREAQGSLRAHRDIIRGGGGGGGDGGDVTVGDNPLSTPWLPLPLPLRCCCRDNDGIVCARVGLFATNLKVLRPATPLSALPRPSPSAGGGATRMISAGQRGHSDSLEPSFRAGNHPHM